jgi:hypothetical protein
MELILHPKMSAVETRENERFGRSLTRSEDHAVTEEQIAFALRQIEGGTPRTTPDIRR